MNATTTQANRDAYVIGLDLGTTAIKAVAVDCDGKIVATAHQRVNYVDGLADGWSEIAPGEHYEKVCEVIRSLAVELPGPVTAVSMAVASGNTMLCDRNEHALTNIISWLDRRCETDLPSRLDGLESSHVRQITGWPCITIFPLAHLAWLAENRPDIYADADWYCMSHEYLTARFTGRRVLDDSTGTTFLLIEQVAYRWHEPFLELLDLRPAHLSTLVRTGDVIGPFLPVAAECCGLSSDTVLIAGRFDHPSAALASGVTEPGQLLLSCGTSWAGFFPELNRQRIIDNALLCDPFLSASGRGWGALFSVPAVGCTIDWYIDHAIAPGQPDKLAVFNAIAGESRRGAGGLTIDLTAKPQPIDAPAHHIARAVMEGAATAVKDHLDRLAGEGITFSQAVMVGGPSHSDIWPEIIGDITGLELTIGNAHAGAYGAALTAGEAVSFFIHKKPLMQGPTTP